MKELIHRYLRNERGAVSPLVLLLLFIPLLILIIKYSVTTTQSVTTYDIDVQKAIEIAARAATMQVTEESQANGAPRIHTANAHAVFRQVLAKNLGLDETNDLKPLKGSSVHQLEYALVVYNIDDIDTSNGAELAKKYTFTNGSLNNSSLYPSNYPTSFIVTETDITLGNSGDIKTTLDRPGVIAIVTSDLQKAMGKDPVTMSRWICVKLFIT